MDVVGILAINIICTSFKILNIILCRRSFVCDRKSCKILTDKAGAEQWYKMTLIEERDINSSFDVYDVFEY